MSSRPPFPPFTQQAAREKELTEQGLMSRREAGINDVAIDEAERRIHGRRPEADRRALFPLR